MSINNRTIAKMAFVAGHSSDHVPCPPQQGTCFLGVTIGSPTCLYHMNVLNLHLCIQYRNVIYTWGRASVCQRSFFPLPSVMLGSHLLGCLGPITFKKRVCGMKELASIDSPCKGEYWLVKWRRASVRLRVYII